jgi:hypothetical protein
MGTHVDKKEREYIIYVEKRNEFTFACRSPFVLVCVCNAAKQQEEEEDEEGALIVLLLSFAIVVVVVVVVECLVPVSICVC